MAPSKIRPATSCMLLVPLSWERTLLASHNAKAIAIMPASNTTHQKSMGTSMFLLHSRRPTHAGGGQNVRDGRRPCGARLLGGRPRTVTLHTLQRKVYQSERVFSISCRATMSGRFVMMLAVCGRLIR